MTLALNINLGDRKEEKKLDRDTLYDILVIGGGPAGLNAALYSSRKGANVGIIAESIGGQVVNTSTVENYLGYSSISGEELMNKFQDHVNGLNIPILKYSYVKGLKVYDDSQVKEVIMSDGSTYRAKSIIIATGSKSRKLNVPGEEEFAGRGVAYCAICDGPLFAGTEVVVAGGGNSAVEAAIDLSKMAKKVTIVHRSQFRADKILVDQLEDIENVDVHLNTQIKEVLGDNMVTGIKVLDKDTSDTYTIPASGVFVEIGYIPNNEPFKDIVNMNDRGEIIVDKYGETNIKGVYAAGDSTDTPYKQIIMAAGDGAKCALSANAYLNTFNNNKNLGGVIHEYV